ncbi:MAG: hypothetical protein IH944_06640 [Armatimonadetes bacterium]|nr:hypothetical protein [Armatimonadota bacterium]
MSVRKQIERLVAKKKKELVSWEERLASFHAEIARLKGQIEGQEELLQLLPRDLPRTKDKVTLKPGSVMARAHTYLRGRGSPAHVREIIQGIGDEETPKSVRVVASQLNSYFKEGRYFTRPLPNTFGLREFSLDDQQEQSSNGKPDGGPA